MIWLVVLVATCVAAAALLTTFLTSRVEFRKELQGQALALAHTAALHVDPAANARAYAARSFGDADYLAIEVALRRLRNAWRHAGVDVRFVYTMVPDASVPSGLAYAVDAEEVRADKSPPGEAWKSLVADVAVFEYRRAQAFEYTDRYGTFVSGFVPVRDAQDNVIMVVGVDLNGALVNEGSARLLYMSAGPVAVLVILAVLASGILGHRLVRPLERLRVFAERVGRGDLTAQADRNAPGEAGDIARALNHTLGSLRETVRNADSTAQRVEEVCDRLLRAGQERRKAIKSASERTADAARRARTVSDLAQGVAADAVAAGATARAIASGALQTLSDVDQMHAGVQQVIGKGQDLARSLKVIGERAATVDAALEALVQVANRSSVLSLNAEIEANQAGESGRGFAVVAREIRRLAEQAAASSMHIERNVAGMHQALESGTRASEGFNEAASTAGEQSARLSSSINQSIRQLEQLGPRLQSVGDRGESSQREGASMSNSLGEAESTVNELQVFLESFEATLSELSHRSQEVKRLLSELKTSE